MKELASECLKKDPTKRISIKELASKGFVKAKLMEISEKIILSHRADEGKSPLEKFSSLNQEKEYTSIRSDAHKLTATTGVEVHLSELNNAASIKMELIKNELEKVQKKGTLTNGFRLGAVVSNFMVRAADRRNGRSTGPWRTESRGISSTRTRTRRWYCRWAFRKKKASKPGSSAGAS